MATKPSTVPAWNTGGANNTTPTAGKIITGFENGEAGCSAALSRSQSEAACRLRWVSSASRRRSRSPRIRGP